LCSHPRKETLRKKNKPLLLFTEPLKSTIKKAVTNVRCSESSYK
jgi:hypothetical protein